MTQTQFVVYYTTFIQPASAEFRGCVFAIALTLRRIGVEGAWHTFGPDNDPANPRFVGETSRVPVSVPDLTSDRKSPASPLLVRETTRVRVARSEPAVREGNYPRPRCPITVAPSRTTSRRPCPDFRILRIDFRIFRKYTSVDGR
jgi:hypothetical protein